MTKAEEAGRTTDPYETWRQLYDANERAWSAALEQAMGSPSSASRAATRDDARRPEVGSRVNMRTYLESMNVPTREDIARLGELVVGIEEKIDQVADRLDAIEDAVRAEPAEPSRPAKPAEPHAGQASHARHALQMTTTPSPMWPDPATLWSSNDRALEMARAVLGSTTPPSASPRKSWSGARTRRASTDTSAPSPPPTGRRSSSYCHSSTAPTSLTCGPGRFVEFLLSEGFDVFLIDWGTPGDE